VFVSFRSAGPVQFTNRPSDWSNGSKGSDYFAATAAFGLFPVHRLNARKNALGSEKPNR
jgi:hypothetical protein